MIVSLNMLLRKVSSANIKFLLKRAFHQSPKVFADYENHRTFNISSTNTTKHENIPSHVDVVIIGGGAMGSSIAYWLKEKSKERAFSVAVIEKDFTYKTCSTCLSNGGLRQQFTLPENIQMSVYGAEFISNLKQRFGSEADVNFRPNGYLLLAGEEGAERLTVNSKLQNELGAVNILLQKHQIKERFPYLNVDDIVLGCLGLEKEGWFDPWSLLQLYKNAAVAMGTQYINAELVNFEFQQRSDVIIDGCNQNNCKEPKQVVIKTADGIARTIDFSLCVLATGPESGKHAELLNIGTGIGILSVPLPVERRKRYVYTFDCQGDPPGLNSPMTFDYTGAYFRREGAGGNFIAGWAPEVEADEPETETLEVDYDFWENSVWPILAKRVPAFNQIKIKGGWGGFYEYNRYDENGIIGAHPYYKNLYIASGFSGHGIQQSPAVGRAVAELVIDGKFKSIDLSRLGFDRLIMNTPMREVNIF